MDPLPTEEHASDGRRRRSQRSRERILHALAEAIAEPGFEPTPEQVAARSGYSVSTILRHFGGREKLAAAMGKLVRSRLQAHLESGPFEGDVLARVAQLVARLAAVFETVAPFLRTMERNRDTIRDVTRDRRTLDRLIRETAFAALEEALASQPAETIDLLAVVLSPAAWSHMRETQGLSAEGAANRMEKAVLRLLGEPR